MSEKKDLKVAPEAKALPDEALEKVSGGGIVDFNPHEDVWGGYNGHERGEFIPGLSSSLQSLKDIDIDLSGLDLPDFNFQINIDIEALKKSLK